MSNSFDFDSFYSGDSDPFDDDGQYVDTQNLIAENAEFGNWLFQLQEACTADRLEDIEAIASMQCPKQVVLRRFTRYGPPPVENDQDSFLSNKSTRLEHRDELLPIAAMYEQGNCPPLPDFPPADSEAGIKLKEILLRPSGGFGGHCLFWVQSVEALKILEAQGASTHDRWGIFRCSFIWRRTGISASFAFSWMSGSMIQTLCVRMGFTPLCTGRRTSLLCAF